MSPAFAAEVARYQALSDGCLEANVRDLERRLKSVQTELAAARKAQKNQKRDAKDRKKVVG